MTNVVSTIEIVVWDVMEINVADTTTNTVAVFIIAKIAIYYKFFFSSVISDPSEKIKNKYHSKLLTKNPTENQLHLLLLRFYDISSIKKFCEDVFSMLSQLFSKKNHLRFV